MCTLVQAETQCADIAFASHLVIEKSLDDHGRGALAQSDISQYYDNLPVIKVMEWCEHRGVNHNSLLAIGKLQLCCTVCVRVGAFEAVIPNRVVGGLTGRISLDLLLESQLKKVPRTLNLA